MYPIISTLLHGLKSTKHLFSSFLDVLLTKGMNRISGTLRPRMTIFLMAGALTFCLAYLCLIDDSLYPRF